MLLPEGYESYESSLRKVLNALGNWDKEVEDKEDED